MMVAVVAYAFISQEVKAYQASNDEAEEDVTFDVNNGSVNVALVDVYETIGDGEAVEKPAYRAGGSRKGKLVLNVPAGTSVFGFTAATPKGTPDQDLIVTSGGEVVETFVVKAVDGFTGYAPYEVAFADADAKAAASYVVKVPENGTDLTFELELTNRVMLWDVQIGKAPKAGRYFFRNIATGQYWGAANDWGTHASLVDNPEFMTLEQLEDGTYTLETNVNNGGTQYYFNGAWMDNGTPLHLQIVDHLGYYTISDGNIYFGYNGQNTFMGNDGSNTSTDPEDDNVKWEIVSEADAKAYLAKATQEAPVNATFLVQDANFGRNNRNVGAWEVSADCTNKNLSGGNNTNNNAESFHSVFTISQTIEGVPNGVYGLTAQGFYRQDGSDNENLPVFFINDETAVFPLKTGTETSMSDASVSFSAGKYAIDMMVVEVTDGTITLGTKLENNTALWCIWDNFTLYYFGKNADIDVIKFSALKEQLADLVATASELDCTDLPANYGDAVAEALAGAENPTTVADYKTAIEALDAAISSVNTAKDAKAALAAMKAEMDATNVYTAEAYEAYKAIYDNALAQFEAGTPVVVVNPQAVSGWHAANDIDDLLLSAWTINDVQCQDYNTALYINTWSVEGETDGSEFKVPFFEYWTGDANSLGATTLTATVPDLAAGKYDVTVWARVRIKNDAEAPTYGITMDVNDGEAVDLCAGENVPGTPFYLAQFTATGVVGADGVLKVNIKVAEDNNVSWLSFKHVTYVSQAEPLEVTYARAMEVLKDAQTYRIYTEKDNAKYYLNETGYLVDDAAQAATLTFSKVAGEAFEYGFKMLGVCYTNPETGGNTTFENDGHIHTNPSQNRNNWEGQVFFQNSDGKYAVRATNATDAAWGANTYWDVFDGATLPEAGYSLEPAYVWNVEEYVDVRPAALAKINNWIPQLQKYTGLVQDATKYTSNAKDPSEGSYEALIDNDYTTFFHSTWHASNDPGEDHYLQAEIEEPVSEFYFFFKKRSQNNNNRPTQIDITAGDDEVFGLDEVTSITEGLPTDASVISYLSDKIELAAPATLIRFTVPTTSNNAKTGDHVFFTFSEFYILPASDLLNEIIESGYLDVTSYTQLTEEDIEKIEAIDKKFAPLAAQQAYKDAMAALKDGQTYRVTTDVNNVKYYLTEDGYLTDDEEGAATFTFTKVAGEEYAEGFKLFGKCFTNPDLSGSDAVLNSGHIRTNTQSSPRDTWEAQVFFLKDGKYAVRSTNAAGGESGWALVAKAFWTVNAGEEGPVAEYTFDMDYIWNVEEFVDNRLAAFDVVKTWNKKMGLVKDASKFSSNAVEPTEGSLANLLDGEYSTFFHSLWSDTGPDEDHYLQAEIENPVNSFIFLFMKRHNNNNNRPTEIDITGTDDEAFGFGVIANITEGLPTDGSEIYYYSPAILMPAPYQFIRFTIPHTNNEAGNNNHVFFTFSEFNLFPAHPRVQEVLESGYMFMTSASQLKYADVAAIEALDKKIDEMNAAISSSSPMVDGIDVATSDANDAKAIFDLSGRRVAKATKGVFVVNGKKVVK